MMEALNRQLQRIPVCGYVLGCLLANLLILYWRRPDAFTNPQFWAEDGALFFHNAYHYGWKVIGRPYAGYLHLYPRLVAWLVQLSPVPYRYIPAVYNMAWLVPLFLCILYLFRRTNLSRGQAAILSVLLTGIPVANEVMLNLTNAQWIWAAWMGVLAVSRAPRNTWGWVGEGICLVLAALSGPLSMIFPAIYILNAIWVGKPGERTASLVRAGLTAACGAVQAWFLFASSDRMSYTPAPLTDYRYYKLAFDQYTFFLTGNVEKILDPAFYFVFTVCLVMFVFTWAWRERGNREAILFLCISLAVFATIVYESRTFLYTSHPFTGNMRYFYLPALFLLFALFSGFRNTPGWVWMGKGLFFVYILLLQFYCIRRTRYEDFNWEKYAGHLKEGKAIFAPINPPFWFICTDPQRRSLEYYEIGSFGNFNEEKEKRQKFNYHFDRIEMGPDSLRMEGWAIPFLIRGDEVVLVSSRDTVRAPVMVRLRPDMAMQFENPVMSLCGFYSGISRQDIPPGDYKVGFRRFGNESMVLYTDSLLRIP